MLFLLGECNIILVCLHYRAYDKHDAGRAGLISDHCFMNIKLCQVVHYTGIFFLQSIILIVSELQKKTSKDSTASQ